MRYALAIFLLATKCAYAGATYDAAVLADSPAAWWKQAELVGSTMLDSSGNGLDGSYSGGFTLGQPGIFGAGCGDTSVLYDGVSGVGSVGTNAAFHIATTGQLTVEAWALEVTGPSTNLAVVGKGQHVDASNAFEWDIVPNNPGNNWQWLTLQAGGASYSGISGSSAISFTNFQHIVGTITDTVATKVYVNGVLEGTTSSFSGTAGNASDPVWVAEITDCSGSPCLQRFLNAYIAMVAIYPTALSGARVLAHYNAALADKAACAAVLRRRIYQMQ